MLGCRRRRSGLLDNNLIELTMFYKGHNLERFIIVSNFGYSHEKGKIIRRGW